MEQGSTQRPEPRMPQFDLSNKQRLASVAAGLGPLAGGLEAKVSIR